MKTNREQIIKTLECFSSQPNFSNCAGCYFESLGLCDQNCTEELADITLATIKELIENNERLKTENETLKTHKRLYRDRAEKVEQYNGWLVGQIEDIAIKCDQIKINTARKIQKKLADASEFNLHSGDKGTMYYVDHLIWVSEIIKELLEEK